MKSLVIICNLKKYYVFFPRIYFYCKNIYFTTEFHVKTFLQLFYFFVIFFVTFLWLFCVFYTEYFYCKKYKFYTEFHVKTFLCLFCDFFVSFLCLFCNPQFLLYCTQQIERRTKWHLGFFGPVIRTGSITRLFQNPNFNF